MTRRTVEVTGPTSNATLLARGVARAARAATGGGSVDGLPDLVLVRRGVGVDPDRLTAYQQLVGETVADTVPAGFSHTLVFELHRAMLARRDFPLPALGMVHVANRVEQLRAVGVGEVLDARLHAERLAPHRRGATVDLVGELAVDGDVVWRGVSTYLAKGARLPDASDTAATDTAATDGGRPDWAAPEPTGRWQLGADVGRRYAEVSGDHNPIHTSRLAARAFGFARPIAHGMYTAARLLAEVGPARGDAYAWEVAFATPVLLPATVSVRVVPDGSGEHSAGPSAGPGAGPGPGPSAGPGAGPAGFTLAAWSRKPHLTGSVRPLT